MPEQRAAGGQFDLVVRDQLLGHAERRKRRTEQVAAARPPERDIVRPPGGAEPAHAMCQPGGREPDLGMSEPAARFSEHLIVTDERLAQPHPAVSSDGGGVDGPHPLPHLPAVVVGVDEEHGRA